MSAESKWVVASKLGKTGSVYRRLWGISTGRPSNFSWINECIAASGRPTSEREMAWVKRSGITAILSLTENPPSIEWMKKLGLQVKHLPLTNHEPPTVAQLREAVKYIEDVTRSGKEEAVLVHCEAGSGRTGAVLAAYLVKTSRIKPEKAIQMVRDLRPGSIETHQEISVAAYEQSLLTGSSS